MRSVVHRARAAPMSGDGLEERVPNATGGKKADICAPRASTGGHVWQVWLPWLLLTSLACGMVWERMSKSPSDAHETDNERKAQHAKESKEHHVSERALPSDEAEQEQVKEREASQTALHQEMASLKQQLHMEQEGKRKREKRLEQAEESRRLLEKIHDETRRKLEGAEGKRGEMEKDLEGARRDLREISSCLSDALEKVNKSDERSKVAESRLQEQVEANKFELKEAAEALELARRERGDAMRELEVAKSSASSQGAAAGGSILAEDIEKLRRALAMALAKVSEHGDEGEKLIGELGEKNEALTASLAEVESLSAEIQRLKEEWNRRESVHETTAVEVARMESLVVELESACRNSESHKFDMASERDALSASLGGMTAERDALLASIAKAARNNEEEKKGLCRELEEARASMEDQTESIKVEKEALCRELEEAKAALGEVSTHNEILSAELGRLERNCREYAEGEAKTVAVANEMGRLCAEIEAIRQEARKDGVSLKERAIGAEMQVDAMAKEVETMRTLCTVMEEKIRVLGLNAAGKDEEMRQLHARLIKAEEELRRSESRCAELSKSMDQVSGDKSALLEGVRTELSVASGEVGKLERLLDEEMVTRERLEGLLELAHGRLSEASNELHGTQKELQEAHVVIQARVGELTIAEADLKIARHEASGSLDKLASAEAELQVLAGELEMSSKIVAQQRIALDEAIVKCGEAERERDEARGSLENVGLEQKCVASLEREPVDSETGKAELAASLSEARAGLDGAQAESTRLEDALSSEIRDLGLKVTEKDEEMRHLRARLLEAEEGLRRSSGDACNCERELSRSRDECESLKSKLSCLLADMEVVAVDVEATKGMLVAQNQESLVKAEELEEARGRNKVISVNVDDELQLAKSELAKTKMQLEESSGQLEEARLALSQAQAFSEKLTKELETISSGARGVESVEIYQTPQVSNRDVWKYFATPDTKSTHKQS